MTNEDPRVLLVARTHSMAAGENPDDMRDTGGVQPFANVDGVTMMRPAQEPNWTKYLPEARRFVLSQDALQHTE